LNPAKSLDVRVRDPVEVKVEIALVSVVVLAAVIEGVVAPTLTEAQFIVPNPDTVPALFWVAD
jgi:hypothetical protein